MQIKSFFQKMRDGEEIWINRWIPEADTEIKGIIQIHHGLAEHSLRYDPLGSLLADAGYVVNAYDMRGHGKTAVNASQKGTGMFGKLADKDGFNVVIEDLNEMIENLKKEYPDKKTVLLGHSFGSFVSQGYVEKYGNNIDACILSGTSGPKAIAGAGSVVASIIKCIKGKNKTSQFLYNLAFGAYNKRVENPKSKNSWLCTDEGSVALYDMDEWCGFDLTTSFYSDMTKGLCQIHNKNNMKKVPTDLPFLFVYGSEDPVGDYGKSIQKLISIYKENGVKDITEIIYEGDRHEPLHEKDHEKAETDILEWIDKK